ncbi:MAG: heat-shock protein Hsp20 [Comamonas sp. SCN 65-56]|uniref:Hsp20/alpha crystallin family protein n=1 Tax=Comamonas sp. SCN 65-56 TaxID=1660095 RepID=UPI0008691DEB|nr:Hsp20/alpha crystallin family protein [Comamonas sp. SCN 65-56]ODS92467.1 MAG: heat-shock protein Hsp20 [Comamonas sp. SCN 65-56]
MKRREDLPDWMWSDALAALDRAERLHRQMFQPRHASTWEPPVDMLETVHEVLIYVALPGVEAHDVKAVIVDAALVVSGRRTLPSALRTATIHRLELPQGRFERHIPLPPGRYGAVDVRNEQGCLVICLHKTP